MERQDTVPVPEASKVGDLESNVYRVGVRIPPFWPEKPALWFAQIEGQFVLSNITTDSTKFYYVIAQLDHQYAAEVEDIILSPPEVDKYLKLKFELIKRLSASKEKQIKQLLMHEELGDRKPSQFLRHLLHLAGTSIPHDFLRTIWASRLPQNIQTVIASQTESTLEIVAELADKVYEIVPSTPVVASTSSADTSEMLNQIAQLTQQVATLNAEVRSRSRSRSRSSTRIKVVVVTHQIIRTRFVGIIKHLVIEPVNV